ncbi:MAG: FAD binding domain-containing protein [Ignavibacteriaceae bacterium]
MIPDLEILSPCSVKEVVELLSKNNPDTKVIAGGTDIIPGFLIDSNRFRDINCLIDLAAVDEMKGISESDDEVTIGAACTFTEISRNKIIKGNLPLLSEAANVIGNPQIRNRATIAGNFINNAPCADSVPPLLVYDALLEISSGEATRRTSLEETLLNPYQTFVLPNEIVTKIIIPKKRKNYYGTFYKLGRRRGVAISRITLALLLLIEDNKIKDMKIASGAVTPIGMRLHELEESCIGKSLGKELFKGVSKNLGRKILDVTGLRWSSHYKVSVVQQMIYQLLEKLYKEFKEAELEK